MILKKIITVRSRVHETPEERFERITLVSMNVKDSMLMNPEYDIIDLFTEIKVESTDIPEGVTILGRL